MALRLSSMVWRWILGVEFQSPFVIEVNVTNKECSKQCIPTSKQVVEMKYMGCEKMCAIHCCIRVALGYIA